jgi:hypothetical protein
MELQLGSAPRRLWVRRLSLTRLPLTCGGILVVAVLFAGSLARGDDDKRAKLPRKAEPGKAEPASLPTSTISQEAWMRPPTTPLRAGEIDQLVDRELKKAGIRPAPLTTDEQFLRRVWLDLTGKLPMPADLREFLADTDANKRAKVIDRLMETDDYASHWAMYWHDVITSRLSDIRSRALAHSFTSWMSGQLKQDRSWGKIVWTALTATGKASFAEPTQNGQAFFLASRFGADAVTEQAAETSRVFLGIQIQCAQCHDHPSDVWKREQFHEFAAYFARVQARPYQEDKRLAGLQLISRAVGEHRMPGKKDPKQGTVMQPHFLDGKGIRLGAGDLERRLSLANAIVSTDNPWFAGAYVNRIWGELMGQSFYQPVDDMGPLKEATMADVLARVAAAFRGSDYNIKQLFRALMNSKTYQRQIRPGESREDHLLFAAAYPRRLDANSLWQALELTLGRMGPPGAPRPNKGPFAVLQSFESLFKEEFSFDPSSRPEEVEGSVTQALLLMNNQTINNKIQAIGKNLLARILKSYSDDDVALRMLYLRTLARRPTDRERQRCHEHVRTAASRAEAFEDILWALLNSTEFQTRR